MLQIIMMLSGLAFSGSNANTINVNQHETTQTSNNSQDDTGGETSQVPPPKI